MPPRQVRSGLVIQYRLARRSDASAIAGLHADNWSRAYRGFLSDAYLDEAVEADRAAVWRHRFHQPDPCIVTVTLVGEADGEMQGFAHSIVDDDPEWGTLLDNLHVRHDVRRLGIATRLMAETGSWLEAHGHGGAVYLWVIERNQTARRLYDSVGGRPVGSGVWAAPDGGRVDSLRYWWPRAADLASRLPT
jgi:GNAT superfamily N-acetyltransferase